MNSKFKKNFKFDNGKPRELGKFIHTCEDLVIVKLSHSDIPYPNAPVLNSTKKVVGKVEEVLGPQDEVYAAIKLDKQTEEYNKDSLFYSYENKFIPKERFLVRCEVEKKKEAGDKRNGDRDNREGRDGRKDSNRDGRRDSRKDGRQMPRRDGRRDNRDGRKDGRRDGRQMNRSDGHRDGRQMNRSDGHRKPFKKFNKSN